MLQKILDEAEKKRLSQSALEAAAALAKGRISKWKANQGDPSWFEVIRMAKVLELPLDYLADDSIEQIPKKEEYDPDWETIRRIVKKLGHNEAMDRLVIPHISEIAEPHGTGSRSRGA